MSAEVQVRGLPQLNRALKKVGGGATGALKTGMAGIAENVASRIRPKVAHLTGRAASSVKGRGSTRGGAIVFGGTAAPHYPWLDFGGRVGRNRSIARPFISEGRYVYPTIGESSAMIKKETAELIENLAEQAGFEVRG